MATTTAETIKEITRKHLTENGGLLYGQCVTAVGWIGGTVPDCQGIVEIPMTDVAGPAFAVGGALQGIRPIFVVRYQGFMWYNASSLVNYAAKSKEVWNRPCPIFIRSLAMEGNGIGHTASSAHHSIFMHMPGLPVVSPITPGEYQNVWRWYMDHDDPVYVSEHRWSYSLTDETPDIIHNDANITLIGISAGRLNAIKAVKELEKEGIGCNLFHQVWLKPFKPKSELVQALRKTTLGIVIDSDFEICGASKSIAHDLMHETGAKVFSLGLEDRSCGVSKATENITPSPDKIVKFVKAVLSKQKK